jgi:hypothetical protein
MTDLVPATGHELVGERLEGGEPVLRVLDTSEAAEQHGGPVVRGVLKGGSR